MASIRVDTTLFPIVLTVFNGDQDEPEVDRYIARMNTLYADGQPYIGATLMVRYRPEVAQLKRIADWSRERKADIARSCAGVSIVAPSPAFRFLFSTLLMMQPMPCPYTVVSDVDDASEWIVRTMAADRRFAKKPDPKSFLREQLAIEQRR
jgi:hypothetical protein